MTDTPKKNPFAHLSLTKGESKQASPTPEKKLPEEKPQSKFLAAIARSKADESEPTSKPATEKEMESVAVDDSELLTGEHDLTLPAADTTHSISMDTTNIEPIESAKKTNLVRDAERRAKRMTLPSADKVRELCDEFDAALGESDDVDNFDLPLLRDYVARLMITLKTHPEFKEVMIDKDTRNIFRFIRATRTEAVEEAEKKGVKKARKTVKSKATQATMAAASKLLDQLGTGDLEI